MAPVGSSPKAANWSGWLAALSGLLGDDVALGGS
jgi:hypothetical protein